MTDGNTKTSFLIDTGADVCVYPRSKLQGPTRKDDSELFAINGTTIATYGTILLSLNLCLRREFKLRFIVADVPKPIIGMDFLSHYELLVDPRN
jgi:predicted aspartyl protease